MGNEICLRCSHSSNNFVSLRTGQYICNTCITDSETEIQRRRLLIQQVKSLRPPMNALDYLRTAILLIFGGSVIFGLVQKELLASIILGLVGSVLFHVTSTQSSKYKIPFYNSVAEQVRKIESELSALTRELDSIYERMWDIPPDWHLRRLKVIKRDEGRCTKCNRKCYRSRVPFHVHHIIPKSKKEGNHSLSNLVLMCEICHSKIESSGHRLVGAQRKNRLKMQKSRHSKRRRWLS